MQLRTFKIGLDNLNLARREDSFQDWVEESRSPVDRQEAGVIWVKDIGEVVQQLLLQFFAEEMRRILLVGDDGLQGTQNLLRKLVRKCT